MKWGKMFLSPATDMCGPALHAPVKLVGKEKGREDVFTVEGESRLKLGIERSKHMADSAAALLSNCRKSVGSGYRLSLNSTGIMP